MNSISKEREPDGKPRLLTQVRERIRFHHFALSTEKVYVYWIRFFIRFHGLRHPETMGRAEVEAFLTHLASERNVAASTHRQALSALLFLHREVLNIAGGAPSPLDALDFSGPVRHRDDLALARLEAMPL